MRKRFAHSWIRRAAALLLALLLVASPAEVALADNGSTIVYKTYTGYRYHRDGCSYLKSRIPITLEEATREGLTPCSRCKPPVLDYEVSTPTPKTQATPKANGTARGGGSGASSGNGGGSTSAKTASTQSPFERIFSIACGVLFLGVPLAYFAVSFFYMIFIAPFVRRRERKRKQEEKQKGEQEKKRLYEEERRKYAELYQGKDILALSGAPKGSFVGEDRLPRGTGRGKWGELYTVYVSECGSKFHKVYGCSGAWVEINIARVGSRTPCQRCRPLKPGLGWYQKYMEIRRIKDKYEIT